MKTIDYMTKDYEGFKQLMIANIPLLAPEWTDTSDDDFGIVLVQLLSYGLDILSYYQDKVANEAFLSTAQTRKSVINICRYLLGYTLTPATPAQFKIVFTKVAGFKDQTITIQAGTLIGTDPNLGTQIPFEIDSTVVIPAGALGNETDSNGNYLYYATATHGKTVKDSLGTGDGTASQKFTLNNANAITSSLNVWTEENNVIRNWTNVDDFMDSTSTDRVYTANNNENKICELEFGDGSTGMVVPSNASVNATYRIGGGTIGNVGVGKITSFITSEIVGISSLTNPEQPIVKGVAEESLDSAKVLAPKMFKTNDRAVTPSDFEAYACKVAGVMRAKCVETFNANGDVQIYIVNSAGTATTNDFKATVKAYLDTKKLANCNVVVLDGTFLDYDLTITAQTTSEYANADVKALMTSTLNTLLNINKFDFGDVVKRSLIISNLSALSQVDDLDIVAPTANITPTAIQMPRLKNLNITVTGGIDS